MWQPVYDETSQSWYYWNTKTNETRWENPEEQNDQENEQESAQEQASESTLSVIKDEPKGREQEAQNEEIEQSKTQSEPKESPDGQEEANHAESNVEQPITGQNEQDDTDAYYSSKEYYDWYMQTYGAAEQETSPEEEQARLKQAHFEQMSHLNYAPGVQVDHSKAMQQMSYFFDVEQYQRERAIEILSGKNTRKKYSKAQLVAFKKRNKEKKIKSLIERMGPG